MRTTKLALMFGIMTLGLYGCGDSTGGGGTKKDSGTDALTTTIDTASITHQDTAVDVAVTTPDTSLPTPLDGGAKLDGPVIIGPVDADKGLDGAVIITPVDSGTKIDGSTTVDGGAKNDVSNAVDGSAAPDAPAKTDGSTSTGTCNYPTCFDGLAKDCAPQGTCVQQSTTSTGGVTGPFTSLIASCYDNGVKMQIASTYSIDLTTATMSGTTVTSVKNGAGLCYTMETPYSLTTPTTVVSTIKSPSGAAVGTIAVDSVAGTQTITCTGQAPVVLPTNCGSSNTDAGGSSAACTTGSCTF